MILKLLVAVGRVSLAGLDFADGPDGKPLTRGGLLSSSEALIAGALLADFKNGASEPSEW